jgi:hypothetical protein
LPCSRFDPLLESILGVEISEPLLDPDADDVWDMDAEVDADAEVDPDPPAAGPAPDPDPPIK